MFPKLFGIHKGFVKDRTSPSYEIPSSLSSGIIGVANGVTLGRVAMKLEVFAEGSLCLS